ncbi:MAG TPA: hypothetical protein VEU33_33545 [Archangium sp.]|nr:hypothetical protein [Archangium sp.]
MFKPFGRRVFAGWVVALALTGCAPDEEAALASGKEEGGLAKTEQGVSVITGYDLAVRTGTYTLRGYIMPQWTAPSSHSPTDWLGLYTAGTATADSAYLNFQHVANKGRTTAFATAIRLPATLSTTASYEVRYETDNAFNQAARSSSFRVKATPTLACASASFTASDTVPTAHFVNVGKSSGPVTFNYDMYGAKDRLQVWTDDDRLLVDTGCVATYNTININNTYPNNRLLVVSLPACDIADPTGSYEWNVVCP